MASGRSQDMDEGDDTNELRAAANQITELASRLIHRDDRPRTFLAKVENEKASILRLLGDANEKMKTERASFNAEIEPILTQTLALSKSIPFPTPSAMVNPPVQPHFEGFQELLKQSEDLVATYKRLLEDSDEGSKLHTLAERFQRDRRYAISVIEARKKATEDELEHLMVQAYTEP